MNRIEKLLDIVRRGDAVEIENARDWVQPQDLDDLAAAYWTLSSVEEKSGLMQLFSDHIAPRARKVMMDFLKIPADPQSPDYEYIMSGKVVAACQLDGHFYHAVRYFEDRRFLAEAIRHHLSKESFATPSKRWWEFWKTG